MTLLLHVSDPHFGTERPEVVEGLVRLARAQAPDVVVLSGDITQRATTKQFAAARAFCDRLGPAPLLAIPGNHDIPLFDVGARMLRPYARHKAAFGDELEPSWEAPGMRVVALNTTRPWRHKDGEVSQAQVEHVAARCSEASPHQLRIAVVHQPLAALLAEDQANLLHGHSRAIERWSQAGVDVVLGGHIHRPYVLALHERHRALPNRIWVVQAGTAVSSRTRHEAGNSVNLLRSVNGAVPRQCVVERWDWRAERDAFELATAHDLVPGPA